MGSTVPAAVLAVLIAVLAGSAPAQETPPPAPAPAAPAPAPPEPSAPAATPDAGKPADAAPGEEVLLRFRFRKGAKFRMRVFQNTTMRPSSEEKPVSEMRMEIEVKLEIRDVTAEGNGVISSTTTRIRVSIKMKGMEEMSFDTGDEKSMERAQENPVLVQMLAGLANLVDRPIQVTMDPCGNTVEAAEAEGLMRGFGISGATSGGGKGMGMGADVPREPVRVGSSWPLKTSMSVMGISLAQEGSVKVESIDRAKGIVRMRLKASKAPDPPAAGPEGAPPAAPPRGLQLVRFDTEGETTFDLARGWLSGSKVRGKTEMALEGEKDTLFQESETESVLLE